MNEPAAHNARELVDQPAALTLAENDRIQPSALKLKVAEDESATTSRAGGMRKVPQRGLGHALLVTAD